MELKDSMFDQSYKLNLIKKRKVKIDLNKKYRYNLTEMWFDGEYLWNVF
jgi:hypothetical protein